MKFDELKRKAPALQEDLKALLRKHGFEPGKQRMILREGTVLEIKISAACPGDKGAPAQPLEQIQWATHHRKFGLDRSWLGQTVTLRTRDGSGTWTIAGLQPSRRKYPVVAKNTRTGKTMLFTVESVRSAFNSKKV